MFYVFKEGEVVQVATSSKSKHKEAIGIVVGYCSGTYKNICKVKLWRNKIIKIFDYNLVKYNIK